MAKSKFGTKRICPITGKKFYDLNKNPVISPYTGEVVPVVPIAPVAPPRWRSGAGRAAPVPTAKAAPEPVREEVKPEPQPEPQPEPVAASAAPAGGLLDVSSSDIDDIFGNLVADESQKDFAPAEKAAEPEAPSAPEPVKPPATS